VAARSDGKFAKYARHKMGYEHFYCKLCECEYTWIEIVYIYAMANRPLHFGSRRMQFYADRIKEAMRSRAPVIHRCVVCKEAQVPSAGKCEKCAKNELVHK